jgi:hypothetical protein
MKARKGLIFNAVETNKPRGNTFDLTHDRKFSTKFGQLTPTMVMDVVPGDNIRIKPSAMVRLAPLIAPIMHRINVFMHFYFVPNRLVFKEWENFITGGEDGNDTTTWPYLSYEPDSFSSGSLPDYMGLPINTDIIASGGLTPRVSPIPFAAYQMIWNEYYRDQNLQTENTATVTAGDNTPNMAALTTLQNRAWQHDYFTSALPWTQKGPEAMLPLGDTAPLVYNQNTGNHEDAVAWLANTASNIPPSLGSNIATDPVNLGEIISATDASPISLDVSESHLVDLSQATSSTINELRRAFKLQVWLERNARGGSRYTESILVHFGVKSSDARLQRPEYIGGSRTPVKVSEVLQTSANATEPTPQGNMAGHAISVGGSESFRYRAEEHGYIIGIMSVMPVSSYQQGIPKHFLRDDKFDYYWPEFANIGEQPIINQELAWSGDANWNTQVFGYTPRYAEYKFINNTVHGDFKNSLDFWHMSRIFGSTPALNADFIEMDNDEVKRIFAVPAATDQNLWCQVLNEVSAYRLMPVFGTPKIA